MATTGSYNLTLGDLAKRLDPNGNQIAPIIEVLNEEHEILDYATFVECNSGDYHKTTVRTGLPSATWRKLYSGVQSSKSSTKQVVDSCGFLRAMSDIDIDHPGLRHDKAGTLFSEAVPHMEALRIAAEDTLIYGDTDTNPERFMGLLERYNTLDSGDDTISAYNVIDGGGSGSDNMSIYMIVFGEQTCSFLYPQGSMAGLRKIHHGPTWVSDSSGNDFQVDRTEFKWDLGLSVKDWRSVGRIANIDKSNLVANAGSEANLVNLMIQLAERIEGKNKGRAVWVMPRTVRTWLRIQKLENSNTNLSFETVEGRRVMTFDEVPVVVSSSMLATEAAVS